MLDWEWETSRSVLVALEILGSAFEHHKAMSSIFSEERSRLVRRLFDVALAQGSSAKRPLGCCNGEEEDHH